MLNNVPITVNRLARQVTLRHPNAMDCLVFRKVVLRQSTDSVAGLPTIGGIGVLDSEDEADYEFQLLGEDPQNPAPEPNARIVFVGQYLAMGSNVTDDDASITYAEAPMEALVECALDPGDPLFFVVDKNDVVNVLPGAGIVIPYQVVGVTSPGNIPPYSRKLLLQPRADTEFGV